MRAIFLKRRSSGPDRTLASPRVGKSRERECLSCPAGANLDCTAPTDRLRSQNACALHLRWHRQRPGGWPALPELTFQPGPSISSKSYTLSLIQPPFWYLRYFL